MPGPDEPTWDFPELAAPGTDPASVQLPPPEQEQEPVYDTGSDGWWRQQAAAQRAAAERDPQPPVLPVHETPLMPPLELVEPEVLNVPAPADLPTGPSPFEDAYLPVEEVWPAAAAVAEDPPRPILRPLLPPSAYDENPVTPDLAAPAYEAVTPEQIYYDAVAPAPEPVAPEAPLPAPPAPVAFEPVAYEPVAFEPVAYEPLRTDEPSFLDEGPAEPELDAWDGDILPGSGGGRRGVGKALAWAGLAIAGVGLVVIAFLLLGKGEPKGTPTVSEPPVTQTTAAVVDPTVEPSVQPSVEPTTEPTVTPTVALAPVVPLTVLNNSKVSHLAERSGAKFKAGGWPLAGTGNYRGQIDTTTIYYPPGQQASAERFGKQFGVRVLLRFATLPGSGMTVVVTRDFS